VRFQHQLDTLEVPLPLFVFVEELKNIYFDVPDGAIDMSVLAILLFVGTMVLSLWATMRVRQVYGKFSQLPASSGASGAETAESIGATPPYRAIAVRRIRAPLTTLD
jgi:hypothetical protein